jgi:tetratricopeptide (TPR) repeat protein
MEDTTEILCNRLMDEGVAAAGSGHKETALARFDEIIARCSPQSEPWMLVTTAGAMFNKATCHRFAAETDEAVAVFDDIVSRFAASGDLPFRRYACKALYNKGIALRDARHYPAAIEAFRATISHCGDDEDSEICRRVALSIADVIKCMLDAKQVQELTAFLPELVARFQTSRDPNLQSVLASVIVTFPRLLSFLRPAAHAASLRHNLAQLQEFEAWKDDPELAQHSEHYVSGKKDSIARDVAAAAKSHAEAVAVIEDFWKHEKPFALFLRNFDLEAFEVKVRPTQGAHVPVLSVNFQYGEIENVVCNMLSDRIPAIGIWNPKALEAPDIKRRIPKLEVENSLWQGALHALLAMAAMVIIRLDSLTAGVETELNAITAAGKEGVTVVIVPDPEQADGHALADAVAAFYNQEHSAKLVERPTLEMDRLSSFAIVASETELQSEAVRGKLAALIARVTADKPADPPPPDT